MKILKEKYFEKYKEKLDNFEEDIKIFGNSSKELNFDYLTESSSVYSSNIEWNSLDLNSFMNLKNLEEKTKELEEIEVLIEAYKFAQSSKLNLENLLKIHKISSKTILINSKRWVLRQEPVWVFWRQWLIYLAIEPEYVEKEVGKLFEDISYLLRSNITKQEIFYYASFIHLVFAHIHPFSDWNGRTARLLEKWFIAEKLWKLFWNLASEEYYWNNRKKYYENINLWVNYYELNYDNCLEFLFMLKNCVK